MPATILTIAVVTTRDGVCFSCNNVPTPGPITIDGFIDSVAACQLDGVLADQTVPDGTFLVSGKNLRVGAEAHVSGSCDLYGFSGGVCVHYGTMERVVAHVRAREETPTGGVNYLLINSAPSQDLDTRIAGSTNGPWTRVTNVLNVGTYTYKWYTMAGATPCNILPDRSEEISQTVNVTRCQPHWRLANNPIVVPHFPPGTITIGVPATMSDYVSLAEVVADYWETALAGIVSIDVSPNGCAVNDGHCVNIIDDYVTTPTSCALLDGGGWSFSTGIFNANPTIHIPTTWRTLAPARSQRTLSHELGHTFGLHHNSCGGNDSVMGTTVACNATTGFTDQPMMTDVLPTSKSTYGTGGRKVCGI